MRKRTRRKGHLIQKNRVREIAPDDISSRHASAGNFRVTALQQNNSDSTTAWIVGEYKTFREAKSIVDNFTSSDVNYYIHADSSRVLYSRKGQN